MRIIKLFFVMLFFFFCLLFLVQNNDVLRTPFQLQFSIPGIYDWLPATQIPYYLLLIVSFSLGMFFCIGLFFLSSINMVMKRIATSGKMRLLETENEKLKQEVKGLQEKVDTLTPSQSTTTPEAYQFK